MGTGIDHFNLSLADLGWIGGGLRRPECVLTTSCGDLYVSDARGGVTRIRPDGSTTSYLGKTPNGEPLAANGFAMLADGSFLVAPLIGGGVYRLHRNGQVEPFLTEVDGRPLLCPNFVLLDERGRIWICALGRRDRKATMSFPRQLRDGYVVLVDEGGARIVADNVGYPNEVRVDPRGQYLYTNETMGGRVLRYAIRPDGMLGQPECVIELDDTNIMDGFTLDCQGGAWITTLVSNRVWYISPLGKPRLIIEEVVPDQLTRLTQFQRTTGVPRELLYEEHGATLRNISSIAFGGPDLRTAYMGSLMGEQIPFFRAPVAGMKPAHWDFGPFD